MKCLSLLSLVLAATAPTSVIAGAAAKGSAAQELRVGSLTLHHCETTAPWCGTLRRQLDPTGELPGSIDIYFEFFPHRGPGPAAGTLVATEGGPGYPATGTRDAYLEFYDPLRETRDVVIMDNRGTGRSGAIDCNPLQTAPGLTEENVAQCGRTLGPKAILYSAGYASDDLEAILAGLGAGKIDLYGDSYGTFFAQVFATRHPARLRSVIFDGAYPLDGPDYAWYPNYAPSMRDKFNFACERSAGCRQHSGTSIEHIQPALELLRREPAKGHARDSDGVLRGFDVDATRLAIVMFGSAPAYASVREVDAAARAYVAGDHAPLLRLIAETQVGVDSRDDTRDPRKFSSGLAAAVMCQDAPQIFDMSLDPATRAARRDAAIEARKHTAPDTYGPFTIDEYRRMPLEYAFIDECAAWPAVTRRVVDTKTAVYPDVPVLVISGDLDNMTPVADGAMLAARFPRGRQLIVRNGFHVNALPHATSACPAQIARNFIRTLELGDTACLAEVPEVRLMPQFAERAEQLEPATAVAGNFADALGLKVVAAAVLTVADVIDRVDSNTTGTAPGLRGGRLRIASSGRHRQLTLDRIRWTRDVAVSGSVDWPGRSGEARADLVVSGPGKLSGPLQVSWREGVPGSQALIRGRLGEAEVAARSVAP